MRMPTRNLWMIAALLWAAGCGHEEILHGLDENQANQVVVALSEAGLTAQTRRDEAAEGSWRVEVPASDAVAAQRLLADRGLPRRAPAGFTEVFGKGSIVPSASEERALYLQALSGELARTVEAIDGVVQARVHLALPSPDPLRPESAPAARGAVLVKASRGARQRIEALAPGIQALVAGAVPGVDASAVAVIVAEASAAPPERDPRAARRGALLVAAAALALLAIAMPVLVAHRRFVGGVATAGIAALRRAVARGTPRSPP